MFTGLIFDLCVHVPDGAGVNLKCSMWNHVGILGSGMTYPQARSPIVSLGYALGIDKVFELRDFPGPSDSKHKWAVYNF